MVAFSDFNYSGYVDDKKSTSGYIFMIIERIVSWKSVEQTLAAYSTTEAEYVACYEAPCHAIRLWNFISTLEVVHSISIQLKLFYDNSSAISFFRNTRSTSCSKHIDEKFLFLLKRKL